MKIEIVNEEIIKPSVPTPTHLKTYTFSALDQVALCFYPPLILLYPNGDAGGGYDHFSQNLKTSLSATLTAFPPLAGKIKDDVSVACNDDGVQCRETRVHSTMDSLLLDVGNECMSSLIALGEDVDASDIGFQLVVQINMFSCGGIAVGLNFNHRLCDMTSFTMFLKSWSAKAIKSGLAIVPDLTVATKIPPRKELYIARPIKIPPLNHDFSAVRLVFDGPKISALKAKSASKSTPQPTRVEAVTALIGKCVMASSKTNNKSYSMPYLFMHTADMRKKLIPTLPETTFGNVVGTYKAYFEQSDTSLDSLIDKLREARMEYFDSLAQNGEKVIRDLVEAKYKSAGWFSHGDIEMYHFTSWCRNDFYEADFGLGKPKWVGRPYALPRLKNMVILIDADDSNRGVEAYVSLTNEDMALFLADPLLLNYASINPAI